MSAWASSSDAPAVRIPQGSLAFRWASADTRATFHSSSDAKTPSVSAPPSGPSRVSWCRRVSPMRTSASRMSREPDPPVHGAGDPGPVDPSVPVHERAGPIGGKARTAVTQPAGDRELRPGSGSPRQARAPRREVAVVVEAVEPIGPGAASPERVRDLARGASHRSRRFGIAIRVAAGREGAGRGACAGAVAGPRSVRASAHAARETGEERGRSAPAPREQLDDATDRVAAVKHADRASHHLDPLHLFGGEVREVECPARVVHGNAVHQYLHVVALAAAQEDRRLGTRGTGTHHRRPGNFPERPGHGLDAALAQALSRKHGHRCGERRARQRDAGGRDHEIREPERIRDGVPGRARTAALLAGQGSGEREDGDPRQLHGSGQRSQVRPAPGVGSASGSRVGSRRVGTSVHGRRRGMT